MKKNSGDSGCFCFQLKKGSWKRPHRQAVRSGSEPLPDIGVFDESCGLSRQESVIQSLT